MPILKVSPRLCPFANLNVYCDYQRFINNQRPFLCLSLKMAYFLKYSALFFACNNATHRYPTRTGNKLRTPPTRTRLAATFITRTGVHSWNKLEETITSNLKIGTLKKSLRSFIISAYWNQTLKFEKKKKSYTKTIFIPVWFLPVYQLPCQHNIK